MRFGGKVVRSISAIYSVSVCAQLFGRSQPLKWFWSTNSYPGSDTDAAGILDESKCILINLILQFFTVL